MKFNQNIKPIYFVLPTVLFSLACSSGGGSTGPEKPRITEGPTSESVQFEVAQISWKTNVKSSSTVRYGTTSGQYDFEQTKELLQTIHEVQLFNLTSNTDYFYIVESENEQGIITSSQQQFMTLKSLADFINGAWLEYTNGNFSAAITKFNDAINESPSGPGIEDAFNGLGWSYASNSIDSLDQAIENFSGAIIRRPTFLEPYAGRGFTYLAKKKYSDAISDLDHVLQLDANFEFSHNAQINVDDVRLGLAEGYFVKQDLDLAQAQVTQLAPNNGLDASSAATWVVDSVSYLTYAEALLAWIEKLKLSN